MDFPKYDEEPPMYADSLVPNVKLDNEVFALDSLITWNWISIQ